MNAEEEAKRGHLKEAERVLHPAVERPIKPPARTV